MSFSILHHKPRTAISPHAKCIPRRADHDAALKTGNFAIPFAKLSKISRKSRFLQKIINYDEKKAAGGNLSSPTHPVNVPVKNEHFHFLAKSSKIEIFDQFSMVCQQQNEEKIASRKSGFFLNALLRGALRGGGIPGVGGSGLDAKVCGGFVRGFGYI